MNKNVWLFVVLLGGTVIVRAMDESGSSSYYAYGSDESSVGHAVAEQSALSAKKLYQERCKMLFGACEQGDTQTAKFFVEQLKIDTRIRNAEGEIPFGVAHRNDHSDTAKYMASVTHPLWVAQARGDEVVQSLVAKYPFKGERPTSFDEFGDVADFAKSLFNAMQFAQEKDRFGYTKNKEATLFFAACSWESEGVVRHLVEELGISADQVDVRGRSPLVAACDHGNLPVVRYLVEECEVDVEHEANFEGTPLWQACYNGRIGVVRYLAGERHANVACVNSSGESAFLTASNRRHLPVVRYFIESHPDDINPVDVAKAFRHSCFLGGCVTAECLYQQFPDCAEASEYEGCSDTPLHHASFAGYLGSVRFLTQRCFVDVEKRNHRGETALFIALERCLEPRERYVACNKNGIKLVKYFPKECLAVAAYLIKECGADVNAKNNEGETPFGLACSKSNLPMMQLLAEGCGADIGSPDKEGLLPIHYALQHADENGQNPVVIEQWWTAFRYAQQSKARGWHA